MKKINGFTLIELLVSMAIGSAAFMFMVTSEVLPAIEHNQLKITKERADIVLLFVEKARERRTSVGATLEGATIYSASTLLPAGSTVAQLEAILGETVPYHTNSFDRPYTFEMNQYTSIAETVVPGDHSNFKGAVTATYNNNADETTLTFTLKKRVSSRMVVNRMFYNEPDR